MSIRPLPHTGTHDHDGSVQAPWGRGVARLEKGHHRPRPQHSATGMPVGGSRFRIGNRPRRHVGHDRGQDLAHLGPREGMTAAADDEDGTGRRGSRQNAPRATARPRPRLHPRRPAAPRGAARPGLDRDPPRQGGRPTTAATPRYPGRDAQADGTAEADRGPGQRAKTRRRYCRLSFRSSTVRRVSLVSVSYVGSQTTRTSCFRGRTTLSTGR